MNTDARRAGASENGRSPWKRSDAWLAAGLLVAVFIAFWPAAHGERLLDDDLHITAPALQSAAGLARIWSEPGATQQYYPVLHTAFWFEHRLWGDAAIGYHLLNVLLHALAAGLVVVLMRRLRLPGGWLAAFIFALHPVSVESVAWISEQKNTLSTALALGAVILYLGFDETRSRRKYALATALFVFALLSKTAVAVLPALLAVILWWRRDRIEARRDVLPLMPWGVLSVLLGVITVVVERDLLAGISAQLSLTPAERLLVAGRALWFYISKLLWPANLTFFYERWPVDVGAGPAWLLPIATVVVGAALVVTARRWRGPLAAALLYVGALLPVLGFVDVEWFVFAFVADHFQYAASLAIIVPAAALLSRSSASASPALKASAAAAGIALPAALAILTWRYSATFSGNISLYQRAVACSPGSAVAHNHLGVAFAARPDQLDRAAAEFEATLRINPEAAETHENLGAVRLRQPNGRAAAIGHLETALRLKPKLSRARAVLAQAWFEEGQAMSGRTGGSSAALAAYERALAAQPRFPEAHYNLANVLMRIRGREPDAIAHYEAAIRLKPDFAEAHTNLGVALIRTGERLDEAIAHFEAALRANPGFELARNNLERARKLQAAAGTNRAP